MTTLLIVDTETTGTDPETDQIVEIGAVLYDCATAAPVACKSALVRAEANPAEPHNGISVAALAGPWCIEPGQVRAFLRSVELGADPIYVAHNAEFDRSFLPGIGERWICTWADATWPRVSGETGSLTSIALAYGCGVVRAHRAIEDCLTLAAVLTRVAEIEGGLDAWLFRATEPKRELAIELPTDANQCAKDAGFRWDGERTLWVRRVAESRADEFITGLPEALRDAMGPQREITVELEQDQNELAKAAGFRWDPERRVWARRVAESKADAFVAGLPEDLRVAFEPKQELIAEVSYDNNQLAKDAGFRWDRERKVWFRRVPESRVAAFVEGLGFRVTGAAQAA